METLHYGIGFPPDLSTHGPAIDRLIYVVHAFMLVLFLGWGLFLLYTLVRYRKREGHKASYVSNESKLPKFVEIAVVLFEVFLLVGLSFPVWSKYKRAFPPEKDATVVRVVAQQFAWNIQYPGEDGKFGRSDPKLVTDSNPLGIDGKDPASWDDVVTVNQFHFPVNKPVIAHITSKDVIHSFGVPVLRVKQDAIPGMTVPIWFQAIKTGSFEIVCSQLCGIGHSLMKGQITVESPEEFQKWLSDQGKQFKPKAATTVPAKKSEG
jgi:cytochrome c oxidase subunit 2